VSRLASNPLAAELRRYAAAILSNWNRKEQTMSNTAETPDATDSSEIFPRAEFFTLAGIAAALSASAGVGEKGWQILRSKEPFVAAVTDSKPTSAGYTVALKLHNLDVDALYVETAAVEMPLRLRSVCHLKQSGIQFGDTSPDCADLPVRIASGQAVNLELVLEAPGSAETHGTITFVVARLGKKTVQEWKAAFLIRHT
jgi:hypothetical protein